MKSVLKVHISKGKIICSMSCSNRMKRTSIFTSMTMNMLVLRFVVLFFLSLAVSGCSSKAPSRPISRSYGDISSQKRNLKKSLIASDHDEIQEKPKDIKLCIQRLRNKTGVIFIDPGHGGRDIGTESRTSIRIQEKTLALETAKLIQFYLRRQGYRTEMSRSFDIFVPLRKRVSMANQLEASLFISIHFNSAPSSAIRGAEVFYYKDNNDKERSLLSKQLAESILQSLKTGLPTTTRGIKHGDFCVVRETFMPAVLIEAAFLSNPKEVKLLNTRAYRQRVARTIVRGILTFIAKESS